MNLQRKKKVARRRKIILSLLLVVLVLGVIRFLTLRAADLAAWPTQAPGISLAFDTSRHLGKRLARPADVQTVLTNWPAADPALIAEYHRYQACGVTNRADYPLIERRLGTAGDSLVGIFQFWRRFDGLDDSRGSMPFNEFIGRNAEVTILGCYAASAGISIGELDIGKSDLRLEMLANALKLTHGGGLLGRAAALNNVMLVSREILMDPACSDYDEWVSLVQGIRLLEGEIGPLDDAIRADFVSLHDSVRAMYGQSAGSEKSGEIQSPRLGKATSVVVGLLGGNEKSTWGNLAALGTQLIQNTQGAYTPDGLTGGLPDWCRGKGRAPSTRDPLGGAMASAYLRHAIYAHAVDPSLRLELRAARLALALARYRQTTDRYPTSWDDLLRGMVGKLEAGDWMDPFAKKSGTRLVYSLDGGQWRFYSVGLDQEDGGGLVDAYRAANADAQKKSDFIFSQRERESRIASFVAPKQKAEVVVQSSATNDLKTAGGK